MLALALLFFILCRDVDSVKVKVTEGWLEGASRPLLTCAGTVHSFKGIPYAVPPVGNLRFKAPLPYPAWNGTRNATEHGAFCIQFDIFTQQIRRGSEDCLFLNVYTPALPPYKKKGLAVIVYIHGGGGKSGSGNSGEYGADFLLCHNVVVVTLNYRLEVLGNLCMDSKDVPGNAGMKDQNLALKWVQRNIKYFGGDPDSVTIMGESAGGASVVYHMMSPMSKGLFKRGISMSGVPITPWALSFYPAEHAFALGKSWGKHTEDPTELLEFLQDLEVEKLINQFPELISQEKLWGENPVIMFYFVPVPEKDFGQERFLEASPFELLKSGKIHDLDLLIGYTSKESALIIPFFELGAPFSPWTVEKYDTFVEHMVPREILLKIPPEAVIPLARGIRKDYFGNERISNETMAELINLIDHQTFIYSILRFLFYLPQRCSNTFSYIFSTVSKRNRFANFEERYNVSGCAHTDELRYFFNSEQDAITDPDNYPVDPHSIEYGLINASCALFTNFAKYGNPTPDLSLGAKWLPYDKTTRNYMDIDKVLTPGTNPHGDVFSYWRKIFQENGIELP